MPLFSVFNETETIRVYRLNIMVLEGNMNIRSTLGVDNIRVLLKKAVPYTFLPSEHTKSSLLCYFNKIPNYHELQG